MPNKKISQLTEVITPLNSDVLPIVSGGDTKKVQVSNLPISKSQIGLSNVDNTSDANKPISTATQTALNSKADSSVVSAHISDTNNPHATTKSQVGLGNVANVDTTNASNISSGTLDDTRLSANVTTQGNTFNAANKLVQLDASAKLPAVDGSQLTNLPLFSPPNGLLRLANAISTTLQSVTDYLGNLSVLQLNSRRLGIASDSGVTTQTTAVIQATTTNSGIAIVPNGTGAITASIPDGTATGGNARGQYAVDLQRVHGTPPFSDRVASGNYSFAVGVNNKVTGLYASAVGGNSNNATAQSSFVGGGELNTSSGTYSFASGLSSVSSGNSSVSMGRYNNSTSTGSTVGGGGGNNATSNYNTISGGESNTASTGTHATVVGGQGNVSSGKYSISGGQSNAASGYASVALGEAAQSTASYAIAMGNSSRATSDNAIALGIQNYATTFGAVAIGGGYANAYIPFSISTGDAIQTRGDAQFTSYITRVSSTLTTGGSANLTNGGGYGQGIPLGNNRAWNVTVEYVAVCTVQGSGTTVVGDVVTGTDKFRFKRVGGTSTIGAVTNIELTRDATMTASNCTYAVGGSNNLQITFVAPTTANATTFRVVAKVSLVEVAW